MIKGVEKYKTDRRENTAPRKLTTMESGLPFQTQERIKRTKEIYHLSNNSLETQFTGAVFIATCLHHIFFKVIVRSQSLSKHTKTTQPNPPKQNNKNTTTTRKQKQTNNPKNTNQPPKKQKPHNRLTAFLNSGDKSSWSTPEGVGTVLQQKALMDKCWVPRERAALGQGYCYTSQAVAAHPTVSPSPTDHNRNQNKKNPATQCLLN